MVIDGDYNLHPKISFWGMLFDRRLIFRFDQLASEAHSINCHFENQLFQLFGQRRPCPDQLAACFRANQSVSGNQLLVNAVWSTPNIIVSNHE